MGVGGAWGAWGELGGGTAGLSMPSAADRHRDQRCRNGLHFGADTRGAAIASATDASRQCCPTETNCGRANGPGRPSAIQPWRRHVGPWGPLRTSSPRGERRFPSHPRKRTSPSAKTNRGRQEGGRCWIGRAALHGAGPWAHRFPRKRVGKCCIPDLKNRGRRCIVAWDTLHTSRCLTPLCPAPKVVPGSTAGVATVAMAQPGLTG